MINSENDLVERMVLDTNLDSIHVVEGLVEKIGDSLNLSEDSFGNVLISVTEAINNAVVHGNKNDEQKKIILEVLSNGDKVCYAIKDEGAGFDFMNLPDPTAPENIEKPNGRGVFLMKSLADEVVFEDNGSKVLLYFVK